MQFGRYYEEFEIGAVYKHWPARTIGEYDNTMFALLSMNQNPLFIDEHYARSQPLGRCPVVDSLVFSLIVGMSVPDTSGQASIVLSIGLELDPGQAVTATATDPANNTSAFSAAVFVTN